MRSAILRARQYLIGEQRDDGLWLGIQSSDASLASLLIVWLAYTGREDSELAQQCAATILEQQSLSGGWSLAPGGSADVSTSVQAYFALKLLGIDPTTASLARARQAIRQLGGADAADGTTRFILALFGQINYDHCPAAAPQRLLFQAEGPRRGPQSIICSHRPVCDVGIERGVRELFIQHPCDWPELKNSDWQFVAEVDPPRIGELGFDELIWHMIALQSTGVSLDASEMQSCENRLREMVNVDDEANTASPQYDSNPLPDTALVVRSLLASGMSPNHVVIADAVDVLCHAPQQVTSSPRTTDLCNVVSAFHSKADCPADECVLPPGIEVCWDWSDDDRGSQVETLIDIDDAPLAAEGIKLLLTYQNPDGGWGERRPSRVGRCESAPGITGAALEALADPDPENVRCARVRAVAYLRNSQWADGSWTSGAAEERIHATSFAIRGLLSAGVSPDDDAVATGVNWLIIHQQADGGWRESSHAEEHDSRDQAAASPTAWALLALVATGKANHPAARRGVNYMVEAQDDDGRWTEPNFAFHDAASNRWLGNDLHSVAWLLLALSRWVVAAISAQPAAKDEMSLRLVGVSAAD